MRITMHLTDGGKITRSVTPRGDWTKERIALLRRLWKTSAPSSEIAQKICALPGAPITKNACCGKARRLGLGLKPSASTDPATSEWRSAISVRAWKTRVANGTDRRNSDRNRRV